MSKYVKNLISKDLSKRLTDVKDAVLVNVIGMESGPSYLIRKHLREKNIQMLVVKRTMACRATEGTSLCPMFDTQVGSMAIVWGCEDFVSLTKEIVKMDKAGTYAKFEIKGGVMDGDPLTADKVKAISKWPNRLEQISLLIGQILSPGAKLSSQMIGPGGKLASQIEKIAEKEEAAEKQEEGQSS